MFSENNRQYANAEETQQRFHNFAKNVAYIRKHNSEQHTYTLGINQFADFSDEEFLNYVNRHPRPAYSNAARVHPRPASNDLPEAVDWRESGRYVTPVKNQASCGSCYTVLFAFFGP